MKLRLVTLLGNAGICYSLTTRRLLSSQVIPFIRPAELSYPKVWHRFTPKQPLDGRHRNYRVEDLLSKDKDKALQLIVKHFIPDEPLCKLTGMPNDQQSIDEMLIYWCNYLDHNLSLACFEETPQGDKLIGINVCWVRYKDEPQKDPTDGITNKKWLKVRRTLAAIMNTCNVFEKYRVDRYMGGSGLVVLPEYRGQNIGAEIMNARIPLCQAIGIKATATVFTAAPSQVLAKKCGYEPIGQLDLTSYDMKKLDMAFPEIDTPISLFMGRKIPDCN